MGCEAGGDGLLGLTAIIVCLRLSGRKIPDGFEQSKMVEPGHPFERGKFDRVLGLPGAATANDFRLVQTHDGFGQRVVVAAALAADGRLDAGFPQAFRVSNRDVWCAAIAPWIRVLPSGCILRLTRQPTM